MYVQKFSIENQQKIVSGIDELNFHNVSEWFSKFSNKENTIVKIELSSIDIERIFKTSLFFKGDLTPENNVTYEELILEDILDWSIYFPYKVTSMMLSHPIILKRKLTHDDLHNCIYCFKGTLKAINLLLDANKLTWSSRANRTDEENRIISSAKNKKDLDFFDFKDLLIKDLDYEIIDRIFDVETMELLIEDEEVPFKELISNRLISFTESQDQESLTYTDDYNW